MEKEAEPSTKIEYSEKDIIELLDFIDSKFSYGFMDLYYEWLKTRKR